MSKSDSVLTAAGAAEFVLDEFIDEFTNDSMMFWDYFIDTMSPYGTFVKFEGMKSIAKASVTAAAGQYRTMLAELIAKLTQSAIREPIYGEFMSSDGLQMGDIRPILSTIGGGSPDATVQLMGGPATGRVYTEWASSNGLGTQERIWLYGDMTRRTFNGHLQMDGLVFTDWDDEGLQISPQDAWLRRTHYTPGDHWGCSCIVAPFVPNFGDPFTLEIG
jgi:hypothetical protein